MSYALTNLADKLYAAKFPMESLRSIDVDFARKQFIEYKERDVILSGDFDDDIWKTSDEYSHVGLHFNFDEKCYNFYYRRIFDMDFHEFVTSVKVFVLYMFVKNVLKSLQAMLNDLKRLIRTCPDDVKLNSRACPSFTHCAWCLDYIQMLPETDIPEREELICSLETITEKEFENTKSPRTLAQFESYFLFGDIMKDYWSRDLADDDRMFYYPLYLWWRITAVIPVRPREFILTERNCLQYSGDDVFLILRKNELKGSSHTVSYKIDEDYEKERYKIPKELAFEIERYREFTKKFDSTELNTLFVTDPHYYKWNQKKHSNSRYLTYINLNTILRYFYMDVIHGLYGKKIIHSHKEEHLAENEIEMVRLGDSRHISMINIIKEGGSPVIAMLLAGHSSIEMSANYYANVKNLIECCTYTQYMLALPDKKNISISLPEHIPSSQNLGIKLNNTTDCYSEKVLSGSFEDCLNAVGPNGEIGYCKACRYSKNTDFFSVENMYLKRMEEDCRLLADTVKSIRSYKGNPEDIGEKMLKLKSSAYSYQKYYEQKLKKEMVKNG